MRNGCKLAHERVDMMHNFPAPLRQPKALALGGHPSVPTHEFIRGFLCLPLAERSRSAVGTKKRRQRYHSTTSALTK